METCLGLIVLARMGFFPPDPSWLEQTILAQRRLLTSGHVILDSKIWSVSDGKRSLKYVAVSEIWFDGNKIRRDWTRPYPPGPSFEGPTLKEVSCFSDDSHIEWHHESNRGSWSAAVRKRSDPSVEKSYKVPHPRLLGMVPADSAQLVQYSLEQVISPPDRTKIQVRADATNGIDCWRISYDWSFNRQIKVWSSRQGNAVVRIENDYKGPNQAIITTVQSDLAKAPNLVVWFPKACWYQRFENGKLVEEERLEVRTAELNVAIHPRMFSIEGIGLTAGTKVYDRSTNAPPKVWDGGKLVAEDSAAIGTPEPPIRPRGPRRNNLVKLTLHVL